MDISRVLIDGLLCSLVFNFRVITIGMIAGSHLGDTACLCGGLAAYGNISILKYLAAFAELVVNVKVGAVAVIMPL